MKIFFESVPLRQLGCYSYHSFCSVIGARAFYLVVKNVISVSGCHWTELLSYACLVFIKAVHVFH